MSFLSKLSGQQCTGALILACLALFAVAEMLLFSLDGNQQFLAQAFASPDWQAPLGRDQFGRNMFARLAGGLRISFTLSLICVVTSAVLGVLAGVAAAWRGGWLDNLLNFFANTILALPGLVLILVFAAVVPGSFVMIYLAISLVLWVEYFRLVRAIALNVVTSPALQSSLLMGFGKFYLFRRHIWPALKADVFSLAAFGAATSVVAMSSVGFVYVGLKPPTPELGLMIVELFPYYHEAPWLLLEPISLLFLIVLGFHLLAGKSR